MYGKKPPVMINTHTPSAVKLQLIIIRTVGEGRGKKGFRARVFLETVSLWIVLSC